MNKIENAVKNFKENFSKHFIYGSSVDRANEVFGDMIPDDAVVLHMSSGEFNTFAMIELKLSLVLTMGNEITGITVPLVTTDGIVFPLVVIIDRGTVKQKIGCLVHELTHAEQLNRMGLEEFTMKAHNFNGMSLKYLFNKLELEAYWNQFKYHFKNGR